MMNAKYYRIEKQNGRYTACPVCGQKNDHIATSGNCEHVAKIDRKGTVYYWWNYKPVPQVAA